MKTQYHSPLTETILLHSTAVLQAVSGDFPLEPGEPAPGRVVPGVKKLER